MLPANLKTPAAATALGMPYTRLMSMLRYRKVRPPHKDSSGHYIWSPEDLEAVRRVLEAERSPQVPAAAL
jgi:hypothetical protein